MASVASCKLHSDCRCKDSRHHASVQHGHVTCAWSSSTSRSFSSLPRVARMLDSDIATAAAASSSVWDNASVRSTISCCSVKGKMKLLVPSAVKDLDPCKHNIRAS